MTKSNTTARKTTARAAKGTTSKRAKTVRGLAEQAVAKGAKPGKPVTLAKGAVDKAAGRKAKAAPDAAELSRVAYKALQSGGFPAETRVKLAAKYDVPMQDAKGKNRYTREINRDLAKAIAASGKLPKGMELPTAKPKAEPKPKRIETIVRVLRAKKGATIKEIAEALLADFPEYSGRHGGGAAELAVYESFARTAISHLRAHRQFAAAKAMEAAGETVVRGEDGRYRIAKA